MARRVVSVPDVPDLPEADRVEGFGHPRETEKLFGHTEAQQEFFEAFRGGKSHHGWLLCGPSGIGKATLAYRLARFVLSGAGERESADERALGSIEFDEDGRTGRLVRALSHPGLLVIRRPYDTKSKRFNATIPVAEVRRLRNFFAHSAGEGAWRVVIIDTADELNINAANAVLKSLEEPPQRTVFLLVSSQPGRLLPTVVSRCRTLQMAPLGRDDLSAACRQAFEFSGVALPGEDDWSKLLSLGSGRAGRVLSLAGMGGIEVISEVERFLSQAGRPDWAFVHALGDRLAPVAVVHRFDLFFELMLEQLAKTISVRARGVGGGDREILPGQDLIADDRVSDWAGLWEDISRSKAEVAALNLDRKAFVVGTAHKLHELAGRGHGAPGV